MKNYKFSTVNYTFGNVTLCKGNVCNLVLNKFDSTVDRPFDATIYFNKQRYKSKSYLFIDKDNCLE